MVVGGGGEGGGNGGGGGEGSFYSQYWPSQSQICLMEPGAWSAAGRRSKLPNNDISSAVYAKIVEPSAEAPFDTRKFEQAAAEAANVVRRRADISQ